MDFAAQSPSLHVPLPTLHRRPHERQRMTQGRRGPLPPSTQGSHIPISAPVYPGAPRTYVRTPLGGTSARDDVSSRGLHDPRLLAVVEEHRERRSAHAHVLA